MRSIFLLICILTSFMSWAQQTPVELGMLPAAVNENSGLLFFNDNLITHNDSGNAPQLFEIDTLTQEVVRTVTISNATNVDWEDIAQDASFIYIADIGNFNGDRQNLRVYRISKSDYLESDTVVAESIDFSYEDQTDFTSSPNSDWDAEALAVRDNELFVFTKEWQSGGTVAYRFPVNPGEHIAERFDSYPVNGLITGASFTEEQDALFLIGYTNLLFPFLVEVPITETDIFFGEGIVRESLPIGIAQAEAISVLGNTLFFSSERLEGGGGSFVSEARLFRITRSIEEEEEEPPVVEQPENGLILFQEFGSDILNYQLNTDRPIRARAIFDTVGRRFLLEEDTIETAGGIDISTLDPTIYYLTFFLDNTTLVRSFLIIR